MNLSLSTYLYPTRMHIEQTVAREQRPPGPQAGSCVLASYSQAQIQIHKYSNTNKQTQMHKYKYSQTNTDSKDPPGRKSCPCLLFTSANTNTQILKYKYTNANAQIQIHKNKYREQRPPRKEAVSLPPIHKPASSSSPPP